MAVTAGGQSDQLADGVQMDIAVSYREYLSLVACLLKINWYQFHPWLVSRCWIARKCTSQNAVFNMSGKEGLID